MKGATAPRRDASPGPRHGRGGQAAVAESREGTGDPRDCSAPTIDRPAIKCREKLGAAHGEMENNG